jgi:predicted component of type VI protein secretion system
MLQMRTDLIEAPLADLVVVSSPGLCPGQSFPLRPCKQRLGRGGADICLPDQTISREHAVIWYDDGVFYLQDDVSFGGTYLNGQRIVAPSRLVDGDELRLGETLFVFRILSMMRSRRSYNLTALH